MGPILVVSEPTPLNICFYFD